MNDTPHEILGDSTSLRSFHDIQLFFLLRKFPDHDQDMLYYYNMHGI